jgi:hypothetical protein
MTWVECMECGRLRASDLDDAGGLRVGDIVHVGKSILCFKDLGFRVWGLGFMVWGLELL